MNKTALIAVTKRVQACLTAGLLIALFAHGAAAQGNRSVVESQGFTPGQAQSINRNAAPVVNNDAFSLLLEQNQQLQTELRALRGLVEEQGFELRKLRRDSLNRYTSTDERLISLESTNTSPSTALNSTNRLPTSNSAIDTNQPVQPAIGTGNSALSNSSRTSTPGAASAAVNTRSIGRGNGRSSLQPAILSEQQLYQMAYNSVINSNFEHSIAEFDQYLSIYPEGRFVTNSHYWKGQAFLYLNRYDLARDAYEIILNQYADSTKLPDAMYGLALAYQGLGNLTQARRLLNEIKVKHPNTGVANLADTRLLSL